MESQKYLQKEQSNKQTNKQKTNKNKFIHCLLKSGPYFNMKLVKLAKQAKAKRKGGFEIRYNCHDVHAAKLKLKKQSKDTQRSIRKSKG